VILDKGHSPPAAIPVGLNVNSAVRKFRKSNVYTYMEVGHPGPEGGGRWVNMEAQPSGSPS